VVGTAGEEWALLTVPRGGGQADLRVLSSPDSTVWTGGIDLPAAVEAHVLDDGLVVLRGEDGAVYTFDAPTDESVRIGDVGETATWVANGAAGLFYEAEGSEILEISRAGSWKYRVTDPVRWASPAEGGALALLASHEGRSGLWLLRHGEEQPADRSQAEVAPPGLVTAWGRRAVLVDSEDNALLVFTVEPIEPAGRIDLGASVVALASSPSSHEIYVSLDGPPRVAAANRFNLTSRELAHLPRRADALRSSLFGESLLVGDGRRVHRIPVAGGDARELEMDWRADVPIGLPGGRVLGARGEAMLLVETDPSFRETLLNSSSDRWWLAIRWNPATARVVADRVDGEPLIDAAALPMTEGAPVAGPLPPEDLRAPRVAPPDSGVATDRTPGGPAPGFYAIVGSARQEAGIADLVESLTSAGYPAVIQRYPDDAGRLWYRGLVGPFAARNRAEAAARQLLRERRLQAWVAEIGEPDRVDRPLR
jgi:hypothetical protein